MSNLDHLVSYLEHCMNYYDHCVISLDHCVSYKEQFMSSIKDTFQVSFQVGASGGLARRTTVLQPVRHGTIQPYCEGCDVECTLCTLCALRAA